MKYGADTGRGDECVHDWNPEVHSEFELYSRAHGNSFPVPVNRCTICNKIEQRELTNDEWVDMERKFYRKAALTNDRADVKETE